MTMHFSRRPRLQTRALHPLTREHNAISRRLATMLPPQAPSRMKAYPGQGQRRPLLILVWWAFSSSATMNRIPIAHKNPSPLLIASPCQHRVSVILNLKAMIRVLQAHYECVPTRCETKAKHDSEECEIVERNIAAAVSIP